MPQSRDFCWCWIDANKHQLTTLTHTCACTHTNTWLTTKPGNQGGASSSRLHTPGPWLMKNSLQELKLRIYIPKIKTERQRGNTTGKEHPAFVNKQMKFINTDLSKKPRNTYKVMKGPDQPQKGSKVRNKATEMEAPMNTNQGQSWKQKLAEESEQNGGKAWKGLKRKIWIWNKKDTQYIHQHPWKRNWIKCSNFSMHNFRKFSIHI